jgi:hypothetical protein
LPTTRAGLIVGPRAVRLNENGGALGDTSEFRKVKVLVNRDVLENPVGSIVTLRLAYRPIP